MTDDVKTAVISECGRYRYRLSRQWGDDRSVLFIMLNPSVANHEIDDPTIRRCIGFAKAWGFGGLRVGNLFAYRATDPAALKAVSDPCGPENSWHLLLMAKGSDTTVCAWGRRGEWRSRDRAVVELLCRAGIRPMMLAKPDKHYPMHPLYLPATTTCREMPL